MRFVPNIAPRPQTTARTSRINALPFIALPPSPPGQSAAGCKPTDWDQGIEGFDLSPLFNTLGKASPCLLQRSGQQAGISKVSDRARRQRDSVRQEHHRRLSGCGGFGQLCRTPHGQDLMANSLKLNPVADVIADHPTMTTAIAAPTTAEVANAQKVTAGPTQAPTPASNFTSPAPIPPIAYRGSSNARPRRSSFQCPDEPRNAVSPRGEGQPADDQVKRQPVRNSKLQTVDHGRFHQDQRDDPDRFSRCIHRESRSLVESLGSACERVLAPRFISEPPPRETWVASGRLSNRAVWGGPTSPTPVIANSGRGGRTISAASPGKNS